MQQFISTPLAREIIRVLLALLGLFVGFRLTHILVKRMPGTRFGKSLEPSALSFLMSFFSIGLKLLLIFSAAAVAGVPSSSILALLGSIALAVGLALQGSLSNFAGGLMILLFKPFKLGDYIEEPGGKSGYVEDISIFYTTLRTRERLYVVLPNGSLSNGRVVNYSAMPYLRFELNFSVAYGTDSALVQKTILGCAEASPFVRKEPSPSVLLSAMADSALIFTLYAWCETENYFVAPADLNLRVKEAFEKANITIPFPQMDVHIEKN